MTIRASCTLPNLIKQQRGAVMLLVALILLIVMSMIAITTMRSGMVEQKITGNDMRAREAFEGGDAGIEYGLAYLTNNSNFDNYKTLPWTASGNSQSSHLASSDIVSGNFSYTPNITYQRKLDSDYIKIVSAATETHDNAIMATNEQYVKVQPILNGGSKFNAPPLALNGCLSGITGNPDIYVRNRPDGIAVGTSHGPTNQGTWSGEDGKASFVFNSSAFGSQKSDDDDKNKGKGDDDNEILCLVQGHLNAHGGQPIGSLFTVGATWEYVFGTYTRAQIKAKADAEVAAGMADSDRNIVWMTDTSKTHADWGSATHPVILIFDKCPKINGGATIYGVVFIDDSTCDANGWGKTKIYGSVIVNGDMSKLNSNTEFYDWSDSATGSTIKLGSSFIDGIYKIPGTWKDF